MQIQELFGDEMVQRLVTAFRTSSFEYWPNSMSSLDRLMDWNTFSELISFREFPPGEIMMAKAGNAFNPIRPKVTFKKPKPGLYEEVGHPSFFSELAKDGYTLAVNAMQRHQASVAGLCFSVSTLVGTKVSANCYASWSAISPFNIHWDGHDVLVLQMEGEKRWAIYGPSDNLVEYTDKQDHSNRPEEPIWEQTLRKGDVLYVPRGWWHKAVTAAKPSLHLTIGIKRPTSLDFINVVMRKLRLNRTLARNQPLIETERDLDAFRASFLQSVVEEIKEITLRDYLPDARLSIPYRRQVSIPFIGAVDEISNNSSINLQAFVHYWVMNDRTVFSDGERQWAVGLAFGRALQASTDGRTVSFGALQDEADRAQLDQDELFRSLEDLLEHGVLFIRTAPQLNAPVLTVRADGDGNAALV